ncbi:MAG: NADH-quinone oxidoreductase subunit C [bacterium]
MLSLEENEIKIIEPEKLLETVTFLKINPETQFDLLLSVSGVDNPENFEVVYHLYSTKFNYKIVLKTQLSKNNPEIDSLTGVFSAADWHERETYDLFGIKFKNHPNLKRILLPDDWKGHPLRKDYKMDDERLIWNER